MVFLFLKLLSATLYQPNDYGELVEEAGLSFEVNGKSLLIFNNPSQFEIKTPYGILADNFSVIIYDKSTITIKLKDNSASILCYFTIFDYSNYNNCYDMYTYAGNNSLTYTISKEENSDLKLQHYRNSYIFVASQNIHEINFYTSQFPASPNFYIKIFTPNGTEKAELFLTNEEKLTGRSFVMYLHTDGSKLSGSGGIKSSEIKSLVNDTNYDFISDQKSIPLTIKPTEPGDYQFLLTEKTLFTFPNDTIVIFHNPINFTGIYKEIPVLGLGKNVFKVRMNTPVIVTPNEEATLYLTVVDLSNYDCFSTEVYIGSNFIYNVGVTSRANNTMIPSKKMCQVFSSANKMNFHFYKSNEDNDNEFIVNNITLSSKDSISVTAKTVISTFKCNKFEGSAGIEKYSVEEEICTDCVSGDFSDLSENDYQIPISKDGFSMKISGNSFIVLHNPNHFDRKFESIGKVFNNFTSMNATYPGVLTLKPKAGNENQIAYFVVYPTTLTRARCNTLDAWAGRDASFAIVYSNDTYNVSMIPNQNVCVLFTAAEVQNYRFFTKNITDSSEYLNIYSSDESHILKMQHTTVFLYRARTVLMKWNSGLLSITSQRDAVGLYKTKIHKKIEGLQSYDRFIQGSGLYSFISQTYCGKMTSPPFEYKEISPIPEEKGLDAGQIAGIVVGCVVFVSVTITIVLCLVKKKSVA
ncbi:hypothetical protein TRFO_06691 [Tritrichomonas foetus]|uniref:Uncharacterized protein n=1 Tax=Tritrichomonas foetus TaxID=1144522 RepID=A0A1J4JWD3_9EUKA|nr:hypothetical protein TRFO_06691 [Tritrichomonas foetus]|eukprot:OHT03447.1 hypothetical protein TRFO_06691 [Tritrichomonas foetus]